MSDDSAVAEIAVVCGPTASGKTAIAHALADAGGDVILISADSRQVYRGFDVGTAKPSVEERRRYRYEGLDLAEPTERYSAARWAASADVWIARALAEGRRPLVVGGTGMYLRALFEGIFVEPPMDGDRRRALAAWLEGRSTDELRAWVEVLDPERGSLGRTQLLRAVEVALLTGERISALHSSSPRTSRWRARYLVVDPGPILHQHIARRLDAMLSDGGEVVGGGWIDEVRGLAARLPDDAPAWNATGYATVRAVGRGELSLAAARERILIDTRRYAKRQRTWFRHQLPAGSTTRIDPGAPDARARIDRWWSTTEGMWEGESGA